MAKEKKSKQTGSGDSGKKSEVFIFVPEAVVKSFQLDPDIPNMTDEELRHYIDSLSKEELAMAGVRIGERFTDFKTWFWAHAELVHALRDSLPKHGPNKIQIGDWDGNWGEFCLEFWGVSADWVRKLLLQIEGMSKFPTEGETTEAEDEEQEDEVKEGGEELEESPTLTDYNKEKALVANLKQLNLTLKAEALTAREDLLDLCGEVEKHAEKVPIPLSRKAVGLAQKHRKPGTCTTGTNFILDELEGVIRQHRELEQEAEVVAAIEAGNKPFVPVGGPPRNPKPLKDGQQDPLKDKDKK